MNAREFARGRACRVVVGLAFPAGAAVQSTAPQAGSTSVQTTAEVAKSHEGAEAAGEAADAEGSRTTGANFSWGERTCRTKTECILGWG